MGGIFGTISKKSCVADLFYGTDYNSHLGTRRGGLATYSSEKGFVRSIHNLESSYFRTKFEPTLNKFEGATSGIGVISDTDAQPLIMNSHLGRFAICTVAKIVNKDELTQLLLEKSDKRKVAFYKSCFKYDLNSYDFIHASINTGMIHPDMVAEMVVAGINNNITPEIEEAGKQRVSELILAQEMANKLIFEHGLHIDELWVIVRDKNITLHGVTSFHATVERAETILESEYSGYKVVSEIKCVQDNRFSKA